jgi:hypothetical protein
MRDKRSGGFGQLPSPPMKTYKTRVWRAWPISKHFHRKHMKYESGSLCQLPSLLIHYIVDKRAEGLASYSALRKL